MDPFETHELQVLVETDKVQVYRLAKPGTRIDSVQITFSPEGIAIQGDQCVAGNGVCSSYGYGRGWFAGQLAPSYLAEKFFPTEWVPALLEGNLRDAVADRDAWGLTPAQIDDVLELLESNDGLHQAEVMNALDWWDDIWELGIGRDPNYVRRLSAIQRAFAAKYAAQVAA